KNLQDTRAQLEALREQGATTAAPPPAPTALPDTSHPQTGPGPATIYNSAKKSLQDGAYHTARVAFDQLVAQYPTSDLAPPAQLWVGEAYKNEGNLAAADSVYQLVATKYPGVPEAASGLYRHGKYLWDSGKKAEARPVFDRVIKEYAGSD